MYVPQQTETIYGCMFHNRTHQSFAKITGAFDLLKNEGHDRTTSVVQCFDLQNCFRDRTNWRQGTRQKLKFLSLTKPQHNFLSHVKVV